MRRVKIVMALGIALLAGCAGVMGERAVVTGVGEGDLLKLRYGPSLGYKVKLGLPDGTEVVRRKCVTEMGQLWCEVSLARDPGVTGYVSADYLTKP
ncbi:MAG: SH3 domain-containing protein [Pseudomonadota bacterium]|nr:SH3 domain-containing protein [Pseudomonadota bacterium]